MKLTTLKSRLSTVGTRLSALPVTAGTVARKRGSAGVRDRERIRKRDHDTCQNCGWLGHQVDHDVPLWAGVAAGGTDHDSNKRLLCDVCHDAKSAVEAGQRARGIYDRGPVLAALARLARERRVNGTGAG